MSTVDNLSLWKSVEKTNPKYTKQANVGGNKITSISPQFQIMNVTEKFGSYGTTWGFKDINLDYSLASNFDLVIFKATFFYPGGEFPIINSIKLFMDNAKTKVDDNFAKKIETDALTKAISKLGFNADIFMGKFDDVRYVEEMKKEFLEPAKIETLTDAQLIKVLALDKVKIQQYIDAIDNHKLNATQVQRLQLVNKIK